MTPMQIIQHFQLDSSLDHDDFIIAADLAEDLGFHTFAKLLREESQWLMSRQTPGGPEFLSEESGDFTEFLETQECDSGEFYWLSLERNNGSFYGCQNAQGHGWGARFEEAETYGPTIHRAWELTQNYGLSNVRVDFDGSGIGIGAYGKTTVTTLDHCEDGYEFVTYLQYEVNYLLGRGVDVLAGAGVSCPKGCAEERAMLGLPAMEAGQIP